MTDRSRRPSLRRPAPRLALLLAGLLAATAVVPAAVAAPLPPDGVGPDALAAPEGMLPSVHYEEAMAHANDRIDFEPGERVSVGFTPRAGDRWQVGGRAPRALPAGRASGHEMRSHPPGPARAGDPADPSAQPSVDPPAAPEPPPTLDPGTVDLPSVDPSLVIDAASTSDTASTRREVFGFLPYWEVSSSTLRLDYDTLSTIAYFSVGADTSGNLETRNSDGSTTVGWSGWTSSRMTNIINAAHQRGTRVVLTISMFAWTDGQKTRQAALLGNAAARQNLARQAAAAVRARGADGINLDFEPIVSGYADQFTALVRSVRAELDAIAPGYQLTFDTTGYIGNYPIEAATAPGGADAIFIMGYDYRTAGAATAGSIAPLTGPAYDITETVNAYAARVHPSKLILGVPYYGRAWSTETDKLNAKNISGTKFGASSTAVYTTAMDLVAQHGRRWDPTEQTPWTAYTRQTCTTTYGCVTSWRQLYYDDVESLKAKYALVNRVGLRGAGIWALGYDGTRPELNSALSVLVGSLPVVRLAGVDRYATASAISRTYAPGVPVAFVATGANFPDSLAGAAAAARLGGPLLLVTRDTVPASTAVELQRLAPGRIVVLGSTAVVSAAVATKLGSYTSGGVSRYGGSDRYATAAAVSAAVFPKGAPVAFVATGLNFPDGLAGAAAAGKLGGPLLLVTRDVVPAATATELARLRPGRIVILGSTGVVSSGVETKLRAYTPGGVTRNAGTDRYATAAATSSATYASGVPVVYVATGANFPDALAGAANAGLEGGPLLLVTRDAVPAATAAELGRLKPSRIVVLGSTAVISSATEAAVRAAAGGR